MKVFIRPVRQRDVVSISKINKRCLNENHPLSYWEKLIVENKGQYSYLAETSKIPIAYLLCNGKCIISFAVDINFRGQDIDSLLMEHCLRDTDRHQKQVKLHVDVNNTRAIKLYHSMRFKIQNIIKNHYIERKIDGYLMVRDPLPYSIRKISTKLKVIKCKTIVNWTHKKLFTFHFFVFPKIDPRFHSLVMPLEVEVKLRKYGYFVDKQIYLGIWRQPLLQRLTRQDCYIVRGLSNHYLSY
jgi:ribosomal protein S18 acetylase RimI-like enzyme